MLSIFGQLYFMLKGVLKFLLLSFFVAPIFIVQAQPAQKREFRGVWVATVANIDWPSKPGINAEIQKR